MKTDKPAEPSPEAAPMQYTGMCACGHEPHCLGADTYCLTFGCECTARVVPTQPWYEANVTNGEFFEVLDVLGFDDLESAPLSEGQVQQLARLVKRGPVPAVAPRETQPWEEALSEWWCTGVQNPKAVAIEDSFRAGWEARARLGGS